MDTLAALDSFQTIADRNNWRRLHTPKNLASAISVEAAELLEIFQWLEGEASLNLEDDQRIRVADEAADILMYLLVLCDKLGIDLEQAVNSKIDGNRDRFFNHT